MTTQTPAALFAPARMERIALPGGGCLLRSREPLAPYAPRITDWLWDWEKAAPERPFLRERGPDGAWRGVGFGTAAAQVRALGAALLARRLGPGRPLALLSGNSVRHALLAYAAQAVGVPCTAISTPYSLQSGDLGKLRHILRKLRPGLLFAEEATAFSRALAVEEAQGIELISVADWEALLATPVTAATLAAIEGRGGSVSRYSVSVPLSGFPAG